MCAQYIQVDGRDIYPAVITSIPAVAMASICPNVFEFFMGHEIWHIMNGDLVMDLNASGIMDSEERIRGEIPEKEFKADKFSWDHWLSAEGKRKDRKGICILDIFI